MQKVVKAKQVQYKDSQVSIFFLDSIENISFKAEDVAENCANLNFRGHKKVSDEVTKALRSLYKANSTNKT